MTDFLSRVAARAVGASAAAQPRLPGLFEPALASGDATLEVVEEAVSAPAPKVDREHPPVSPLDVPARQPRERAPGIPPASPLESRPPEPTSLRPERAPKPAAELSERIGHAPGPSEVVLSAPAVPAAVHAATDMTPAAPAPLTQAVPAARASDAAPVPATVATREEPPPVRVHIGRLEVRANVHEPPSEQPRREPSRPEGVSLADYLRGKREVRS